MLFLVVIVGATAADLFLISFVFFFSDACSHFTSQSLRTNYPREMEAKIADATQMVSKKCTTTFSLLHFGQYAAKSD